MLVVKYRVFCNKRSFRNVWLDNPGARLSSREIHVGVGREGGESGGVEKWRNSRGKIRKWMVRIKSAMRN